jgi:hypothetical protein
MRLDRRGDALVLDITGPPEARPAIAELFDASAPPTLVQTDAHQARFTPISR